MLEFEDLIFRTRALGQSHPFSPAVYRYTNATVEHERERQPVEHMGIWAGHAITAGYCLRRVEEEDTHTVLHEAPEPLPDDLDQASTHLATLLRTEGADPYLLYPEDQLVDALDHLIAGEIDRRLSQWDDIIDPESWELLEDYLAWWVIKGYALRVVERFVSPSPADSEAPAEP